MKLRKNISMFLTVGIILNNLYFYANASNIEIFNRYETLKGEQIVINDSTEGELHEIEIFGNTIQDENNLEDIQSVGDLYVDEKGEPILDSQGREQYKIDILTTGKNLFNIHDKENIYKFGLDSEGNPTDGPYDNYLCTGYIPVKPMTTYYKSGNNDGGSWTFFYDKNKNIVGEKQIVYNGQIHVPSDAYYMRTNTRISAIDSLQIELGEVSTSYSPYKSNKTTILLPTQLQKVRDIRDRLYWDSEKGKYVVEKNILDTADKNGIENWLINNPTRIIYCKNKEIIETDITKKISLPTYDEKTYIYTDTENGINPTLKVTVDRILNICEKTIKLAQENPTIDNISTARMWINLLEESTLKDNFNDEINNITQISDLTIEPKKVSSSLDVYVKSDNALSLAVSTNSVIFENFTGVQDMEKLNAINITVNSSLPYQLNSYLLEEIKNGDGSNKIEKELFNIKLNGETDYKAFNNINEKLVLKDNCLEGNNNQFGIDLIFRGSLSHKADVYKTVIKLEAEQK